MVKTDRKKSDPLQRIASEGYIGFLEDEETEGQILEVRIEDILDSPYQTREPIEVQDEEELAKYEQLIQSIKDTGFNPPLPVQRHAESVDKYFLPSGGHSRRDAAREAGLESIPVIVVEYSDEQVALATAHEKPGEKGLLSN